MTKWTIRRAKLDDAHPMTLAFRAAYAPFLASIPNLPDVTGGIAQDIATREVWVAEKDGTLAGGVVLNPENDALMVENLAVDPSCARQGVGEALLYKAASRARDQGFAKLELCTHQLMTATLGYYRRQGWTESLRSGDKVFMTKPV